MFKNYKIKFKYADKYSNWDWRNQQCVIYAKNENDAKLKCLQLYGLGVDCDYEILSIEEEK